MVTASFSKSVTAARAPVASTATPAAIGPTPRPSPCACPSAIAGRCSTNGWLAAARLYSCSTSSLPPLTKKPLPFGCQATPVKVLATCSTCCLVGGLVVRS